MKAWVFSGREKRMASNTFRNSKNGTVGLSEEVLNDHSA